MGDRGAQAEGPGCRQADRCGERGAGGRQGQANPTGRVSARSGQPPTTTTYDPRAQALRVVQAVGDELAAARGNENYTPGERAALANSATTALRLYSRLCGSLDVSESQITKSAPWGRILGTFHRVFARHPEATKALEEFIADLRERGE